MEVRPIESYSYASVIPKFDLEQAQRLFYKGITIGELVAAAERLGNSNLKEEILKFAQEFAEDMETQFV